MGDPLTTAVATTAFMAAPAYEQRKMRKEMKKTNARQKAEDDALLKSEAEKENAAKRATYSNTRKRIKRGEQRGRMSTILGQGSGL